jgi:hypothetical protein
MYSDAYSVHLFWKRIYEPHASARQVDVNRGLIAAFLKSNRLDFNPAKGSHVGSGSNRSFSYGSGDKRGDFNRPS